MKSTLTYSVIHSKQQSRADTPIFLLVQSTVPDLTSPDPFPCSEYTDSMMVEDTTIRRQLYERYEEKQPS